MKNIISFLMLIMIFGLATAKQGEAMLLPTEIASHTPTKRALSQSRTLYKKEYKSEKIFRRKRVNKNSPAADQQSTAFDFHEGFKETYDSVRKFLGDDEYAAIISYTKYESILFKKIGKVGRITLNRPEARNALSNTLIQELAHAIGRCDADPKIRCIIVQGSNDVFSAGADIKEMLDKGNVLTKEWQKLGTCSKPTIASVSGNALGGGSELAQMCDIIIASKTAKFAQTEIKIGTMPGAGGTQRLPHSIGKSNAMLLCLTGNPITAQEAKEMNLVSHVVPVEELDNKTMEIAETIASYSLPVLKKIKKSVKSAFSLSLPKGLEYERRLFKSTFLLKDQEEGMAAFVEKRKPNFQDE